MTTDMVKSFLNKRCFIRCKDREETELTGEILGINQLGVVAKYTAHGRDFEFYVPLQNLSYIERKIVDSED